MRGKNPSFTNKKFLRGTVALHIERIRFIVYETHKLVLYDTAKPVKHETIVGSSESSRRADRAYIKQEHTHGGVGNAGIAAKGGGIRLGHIGAYGGVGSVIKLELNIQDRKRKWTALGCSDGLLRRRQTVHGAQTLKLRPDSVVGLGVTGTPRFES
jgi:hypothetical protein